MKIYQIISFCILIFQIQAQTQANNVTNNNEIKKETNQVQINQTINTNKDLPKKNILIQILCLLENISDLKEKLKTSYNNTSEFEKIFDYINDIDINIIKSFYFRN